MQYQWNYSAEQNRHVWVLKRNCALTPRQLATWFGTLALVSLAIAAAMALRGAWMVVPFTLVEIGALGIAFVIYARHAADYERIVATRDRLVVETSCGERVRSVERNPAWIRVEYRGALREPIRLVAGREEIEVGRFVPDDRKQKLVQELRGALSSW